MKEHDYCNCDPSYLPATIEVICDKCRNKEWINEDELEGISYYICGFCEESEFGV